MSESSPGPDPHQDQSPDNPPDTHSESTTSPRKPTAEDPFSVENMGKNLKKMRHSVTFKMFSMLFLLMVAMIPVAFVQSLVNERQSLQRSTQREISQKWADQQTLQGPVLSIPYDKIIINDNKKVIKSRHFMHLLPDTLNVEGQMEPQKLHRGIYDIVVYNSDISLAGAFNTTPLKQMTVAPENIHWDQAFVSMGLSDLRGIEESIQLQWGSTKKIFDPGTVTDDLYSKGVHVMTPLQSNALQKKIPFSLAVKLKGNQRLFFTPVGKETQVKLQAPWGSPSFDGAFLPDDREVLENDFNASWKVLHLNRNYPQHWEGKQYTMNDSAFGVYLIEPLDHYHKVERSVKYALFFIGLTFLTFFFVEVLTRRMVHPLQYLLVGFALSVFYTLLLSISEHLGFDAAYGIAAVMTVGLITAYAAGFLKSGRLTAAMGTILTTLYTFIYVIIYQQDYALLMGSLGLFGVLALVMFFSRKMDLNT